jgi:hypothetical protein
VWSGFQKNQFCVERPQTAYHIVVTNVSRNSIEVVEPSNDIPTRVKYTTTQVGALVLDVNYDHIRKRMLTGVCDSTS